MLLSRCPQVPFALPSCPSEVVGGVAGGLVKGGGCMRLGFNSSAPLREMFATKCLAPSPDVVLSTTSALLGTRMNSLLSLANLMRPEDTGRLSLFSRARRTGCFVEGCGASWRRFPARALRSMTGHGPLLYRMISRAGVEGRLPLMGVPSHARPACGLESVQEEVRSRDRLGVGGAAAVRSARNASTEACTRHCLSTPAGQIWGRERERRIAGAILPVIEVHARASLVQ